MRYYTGMIGATEGRRCWLLTLYALMLAALWVGAIHQFSKHSDIAWPSLGGAIALTISGIRMARR